MIPDTFPYYVFIRLSIWGIRAVFPASVLYCIAHALGYGLKSPWLLVLALLEVVFYFCVSMPRQLLLNRSAHSQVQRSRQQRQELFDQSLAHIPSLENFLEVWFKGASLDNLHREEIKDLLAWIMLYKKKATPEDEEELEGYVGRMETVLQRTFPPGRGPHQPSRSSTDALQLQHKPLIFYLLGIGGDDLITYLGARFMGFDHYRLPLSQSLTVFPFRPHTIFTWHTSPSRHLSYFYRPHTSKQRRPVLFIHGIGAGMRTYSRFLGDFIKQDTAPDGQTGIIALEIMPISMRISRRIPPRREMMGEILKILAFHGWDQFSIMAHSFGTILATHLLQEDTGRIGPVLLVDPVTISIHWGDIPYNFLYRKPRKASEWQLHFFASTEMCIADSITRRFDWTENVLWKQQMQGRRMGVVLSGRDIILDPFQVLEYLAGDAELSPKACHSNQLSPSNNPLLEHEGLGILFYDHLNHAGVFDKRVDWQPLVDILQRYCTRSGR